MPSAMAGTFILKPVENISGSSTNEPGAIAAPSSSFFTLAKLAGLFSQTMSNWQQ